MVSAVDRACDREHLVRLESRLSVSNLWHVGSMGDLLLFEGNGSAGFDSVGSNRLMPIRY